MTISDYPFPTVHSDDLRYVGRGPCGLPLYRLDLAAHEARLRRYTREQIELNERAKEESTTYEQVYTGGERRGHGSL